MRTVKANDRQTLFDIAVQMLGSIEKVFALARLNNLSPTAILQSGQDIIVELPVADPLVVNYYEVKKLIPACEDTGDNSQTLEGIGYWFIGSDFKVS